VRPDPTAGMYSSRCVVGCVSQERALYRPGTGSQLTAARTYDRGRARTYDRVVADAARSLLQLAANDAGRHRVSKVATKGRRVHRRARHRLWAVDRAGENHAEGPQPCPPGEIAGSAGSATAAASAGSATAAAAAAPAAATAAAASVTFTGRRCRRIVTNRWRHCYRCHHQDSQDVLEPRAACQARAVKVTLGHRRRYFRRRRRRRCRSDRRRRRPQSHSCRKRRQRQEILQKVFDADRVASDPRPQAGAAGLCGARCWRGGLGGCCASCRRLCCCCCGCGCCCYSCYSYSCYSFSCYSHSCWC
jgi:hypothetical protein